MVTLAQRIEELRTAKGLSRPAAAAALGFPKGAFEKFETGRQTPTKDQQEKMANYFGVSLFYLRGESSDPTRQEDWMSGAVPQDEPVHVPTPAPRKAQPSAQPQGTVMDSVLSSRQVQDLLRSIVLDTLRSPEGQELIARAVHRELLKQK